MLGLATPAEGSAIAVLFALIAGRFCNGLTRTTLVEALETIARMTGTIFIILAAISILGFLAGQMGWSEALADWVDSIGLTGNRCSIGLTGNRCQFFLIAIFLVAGMFMDTPLAMTLLISLFVPQAVAQGIDPVHLGIALCLNLCVGLITSSLGKCPVVVAALTDLTHWRPVYTALPFIAVQILLLLVLGYWPELSLALPRLAGFSVN